MLSSMSVRSNFLHYCICTRTKKVGHPMKLFQNGYHGGMSFFCVLNTLSCECRWYSDKWNIQQSCNLWTIWFHVIRNCSRKTSYIHWILDITTNTIKSFITEVCWRPQVTNTTPKNHKVNKLCNATHFCNKRHDCICCVLCSPGSRDFSSTGFVTLLCSCPLLSK